MTDQNRKANFEEVEKKVGITFHDRQLLRQALVHRSYLNENPTFPLPSNERLEFLGDAVLGFVVADFLYRRFPHFSEGELTRLRAALVRGETLARLARSLNLGRHIHLGRGEEASGGRRRQSLLACTFEALVGAAYLDRGLEAVTRFTEEIVVEELNRVLIEQTAKDFKSSLQELIQAMRQVTPSYRTLSTEGPDHDKTFTVAVYAGERLLGEGQGRSKQSAEQDAARHALENWH